MDRRSLLRMFALAPIAAAGQAVGAAVPTSTRPGALAGTLRSFEPLELDFVKGTLAPPYSVGEVATPTVFVQDELHQVREVDVDRGWATLRAPITRGGDLPVTDKATFFGCDLQRLERRPGDRFVLTTDQALTADQHIAIRRAWARFWADGRDEVQPPAVFICDGIRLSVVSADRGDGALPPGEGVGA